MEVPDNEITELPRETTYFVPIFCPSGLISADLSALEMA
jgi:hypothetical protein